MTPLFKDFYTGPFVEGMMWGLVIALLAVVAIWAAVELVKWVFRHMKAGGGAHRGWKNLPKVFRNSHATN